MIDEELEQIGNLRRVDKPTREPPKRGNKTREINGIREICCFDCGKWKSLDQFYAKTKPLFPEIKVQYQSNCISCAKERSKMVRKKRRIAKSANTGEK